MEQTRLLFREWVAIAIVIGLIGSLAAIAWISELGMEARFAVEEARQPRLAKIELSGAVKKPGIYYARPGSCLKETLQEAGLTPQADRKKIKFRKIIYDDQKIEIPHKTPRKKKGNS